MRLVLGIAAMTPLIILASLEPLLLINGAYLLPGGYHTDLVINALSTDTVMSFLPILAVLPFAASYVEDIKSKFARFYLARTSYGGYLCSRISVCFLCGGFVIAAGVLLAWGLAALVFLPMEEASVQASAAPALLRRIGMLFLYGGFWAVVGMALSTLMESKYIAYASPFVLYYLLVILHERYFPTAYVIYPSEWLSPSESWPFGYGGAAALMVELTIIFAIIFVLRAGRRLRQL